MATNRPLRRKGAAPATPLLHNLSDNDNDSLTVAAAASIGKSPQREKSTDPWVEARINYLSAEITRLEGGPAARRLLKQAKAHYRWYRCYRLPRSRFLSWSYLDQVASQLCGREARSSKQEATL